MTSEPSAVDLTNCDREPIHIPGGIQPHGIMLVCAADDFTITHVSENAPAFFGRDLSDLIQASLGDVVGASLAHDLRNAAAKAGGSEVSGVVLGARIPGSNRRTDAAIHRHKDRVFVELEVPPDEGKSARESLDLTQSLIRRIGIETEVERIAATGARLVRAMLGYDRVMVYRFLHNGAGRVIGEAKRADLHGFMGQHFPASDIPAQARRLYLLNPIRMISDSGYAPVPLVPGLAPGEPPVDMSFAQLRSVSPIHLEYLRNMGVGASLSISIIVDGELWGLISCHHEAPKITPLPLRIAAELFGMNVSLQIALAQHRAEVLAAATARERLDQIMARLRHDRPVGIALREQLAAFIGLIPCDGVGLWIDGQWSSSGAAPPVAAVEVLVQASKEKNAAAVWGTQDAAADIASRADWGDVAGVLSVPISASPAESLFLFRYEEAHKIEWAGQPLKTVVSTPMGERLTPRGSFETWREDVKGRSPPWTEADLAVAEVVRTYLRDFMLRHSESTAEERARLDRHRRIVNDELNHRVKNIIALVKSIALQTSVHAESVADYSQSLEGRLRALAYAHDQSLSGAHGGELSSLIEAEASLHRYRAEADRIVAEGPGVALSDRAFGVVALVIHEMMTNAAKYGALSASHGKLAITWSLTEDGDCVIGWTEREGPDVKQPTRVGFGTKLVNTIAYDLGGSVSVDYLPGGVQARFTIPADHISRGKPAEGAAPAASRVERILSGRSVLVVEDQLLIALDVEQSLLDLDAAAVRLAPSVSKGLETLDEEAPDAAILDFDLGEETSEGLADELTRRAIPFAFATGYGDSVMIPKRFRDVPIVRKPLNAAMLSDAFREIFRET